VKDQLAYVQDKRMLLDHLQKRLGDLGSKTVSDHRRAFAGLAAALDAMSPLKVLGRGYAMVQTSEGSIVKSWRDAPAGSVVNVTLGEGGLSCIVDKHWEGEEHK
jgi:exodeoxyribonuclease VII large subunit